MKRQEVLSKIRTKKLPFVVAKSAQSMDGKIATSSGRSKWITSARTRDFARHRRSQFDAILAGIDTVLKDDPSLDPGKPKKDFKKVILDSRLRIPLGSRLFRNIKPGNCIIVTGRTGPAAKRAQLLKKGVRVVVCPQKNGKIRLKWLFERLLRDGIKSILIEGGAHVTGDALKNGLVDMMHIYIAPRIWGDETALSSVAGLKVTDVQRTHLLKNIRIRKIGDDLLVEGYVHRDR